MGTLQSWRKAYGALKDTTKVGHSQSYESRRVSSQRSPSQKNIRSNSSDTCSSRCCLLPTRPFPPFA
uniref:Uncharacterized protein n=1 Tax=Brassica oleracea TaxID=3712 RepID=A0A3P6DGY3_BRAOL|nr:unnamed protein product [Brassica oleracea]